MSRTFLVGFFVSVVALLACTGDDPVIPSSDGGTSGSSGTSGTSGTSVSGKLAFVSKEVPGNFGAGPGGGLAGGDKICTDEARAAGRTGTFKALICVGVVGSSGLDRMGAGPWKTLDGAPVPAKAVWSSQPVLVNRSLDDVVRGGIIWTGCDDSGLAGDNCQNWTTEFTGGALTGEIGGNNQRWLSTNVTTPCSDKRPVYCFED